MATTTVMRMRLLCGVLVASNLGMLQACSDAESGGDSVTMSGGALTTTMGSSTTSSEAETAAGEDESGDEGEKLDLPDDTGQADAGDGGGGNCSMELTAIVRDFSRYHGDFEAFYHYDPPGAETYAPVTMMVESTLGPDGVPVWLGAWTETPWQSYFTGEANFDMWYRDLPPPMGTDPLTMPDGDKAMYNITSEHILPLTPVDGMPNLLEYSSYGTGGFFPLTPTDGFGNENIVVGGEDKNFHFTTQIHETFTYQGGEVFVFAGDDDVWVFINEQLVIDKGGLGGTMLTVNLDELGLTMGQSYPLDFFHAERRTDGSNVTIQLSDFCLTPVD